MRIDIRNIQNKVKIDKKNITACAGFILNSMGEKSAELSILFVDDEYIKKLNWKYRKVKNKTDVLAFPMREGSGVSKANPLLGDVVISVETAKREAKKRKNLFQKELDLYLVHGILHLLGYDDVTSSDKKKMRSMEDKILRYWSKSHLGGGL